MEVLGPNGWQAARVLNVTPFRIQVRYKHGFIENFIEWVPFSVDMVRYVCDDSDSELLDDLSAKKARQNGLATSIKQAETPQEGDSKDWIIYCNQCQLRIRRQRYYCTYCESPSDGYAYESYDLCITCFQTGFRYHQHPRSSFAVILRVKLIFRWNELWKIFHS